MKLVVSLSNTVEASWSVVDTCCYPPVKSLDLAQQLAIANSIKALSSNLDTDFRGYHLNTLAIVVMNTYLKSMHYLPFSQAHFGIGDTLEPSNTTLLEWEALGLLPINRVSMKTTD